jgi:hypothetical protein
MRTPTRRESGPGLLAWLLLLLVLGVALALPLLGAWAGSALAIQHGASALLAAAAGLLLFPVLPVVWDLLSAPGRKADGTRAPRRLKLPARLLLRTWALHLAFLGAMLVLYPQPLFTALTTRGDWMLPPSDGDSAMVRGTRRFLSTTAQGLERAHASVRGQSAPLPGSEPSPPSVAGTGTGSREQPDEEDSEVAISWQPEPKPPEPRPGALRLPPDSPRYEVPPPAPPTLKPEAPKTGVRIIDPQPQAQVKGRFLVELENPEKLETQVTITSETTRVMHFCTKVHGDRVWACSALGRGNFLVRVLAGKRSHLPTPVADLEVVGQ